MAPRRLLSVSRSSVVQLGAVRGDELLEALGLLRGDLAVLGGRVDRLAGDGLVRLLEVVARDIVEQVLQRAVVPGGLDLLGGDAERLREHVDAVNDPARVRHRAADQQQGGGSAGERGDDDLRSSHSAVPPVPRSLLLQRDAGRLAIAA